ncbi:MAG: DUF2878 family protein [Steroidobacteraceae bacterium]
MSDQLRWVRDALRSRIFNFVLFQLAWFIGVTSAARGEPLLALLVVSGATVMAIGLRPPFGAGLRLALLALLVGILIESLLAHLRVTEFKPAPGNLLSVPLWMLALWALLSTTLSSSLGWLRGRPLLGALVGASGGALSYALGARLGALTLPGEYALGVIAAVWAIALPLLVWLARSQVASA